MGAPATTSPGAENPCTTLHLPAVPASVGIARRQMVSELAGVSFRQTFLDDAQLVLAEMAANGVEHGLAAADGTIEISWCVHDDVLRISVCDGGSVDTLKPMQFTDAGLRGRGLAIIDHICDRWDVQNDDGTRVTAELRHERYRVDDDRLVVPPA